MQTTDQQFLMAIYILIGYVLTSAWASYRLWVAYLAVMALKRARIEGKLDGTNKALGVPVLVFGYLLDFYVNVVVMSVVLMEFPRELTVTKRLKRHNKAASGWGKRVAKAFEPVLDPHDPSGKHI